MEYMHSIGPLIIVLTWNLFIFAVIMNIWILIFLINSKIVEI